MSGPKARIIQRFRLTFFFLVFEGRPLRRARDAAFGLERFFVSVYHHKNHIFSAVGGNRFWDLSDSGASVSRNSTPLELAHQNCLGISRSNFRREYFWCRLLQ